MWFLDTETCLGSYMRQAEQRAGTVDVFQSGFRVAKRTSKDAGTRQECLHCASTGLVMYVQASTWFPPSQLDVSSWEISQLAFVLQFFPVGTQRV